MRYASVDHGECRKAGEKGGEFAINDKETLVDTARMPQYRQTAYVKIGNSAEAVSDASVSASASASDSTG
jgi:hypothetical protein